MSAAPATTASPVLPAVLVCRVGPYALRGRPLLAGLPIAGLAGIGPCGAISAVPGTAPEMLGLTTYEGQVIPVFSAVRLLGLPELATSGQTQLVTFRVGPGLAGLLVEEVTGSLRPLHYAPVAALDPLGSPALVGAIPQRDGWLAVLDPYRIPSLYPRAA
jgi:chemotaxis signal transduction protein